jgi:superoxide dismutase, Fe-Mn family
MKFQLNPLPYPYDALEPFIDGLTMQIHHEKHHAAYINNLNGGLEKHPELADRPLEWFLSNLNEVPEDLRSLIRNHGGGTWNHNLFWEIMAPQTGGLPKGVLAEAIDLSFGNFDNFKVEFEKAANGRFGSGWAWLVKGVDRLSILSTANQDNPLFEGLYPILGLDVWEHAYYLKYQNRRAEYVSNWWNIVNWEEVARRYNM